ncbi:MAG: alginate lyase family protein [Legionella sp.]|nr:alginate lyase family protein [Legionella sp.]
MYQLIPLRYFHTLRHLKPQQFFYRFFYAVKKIKLKKNTTQQPLRAWHQNNFFPNIISSADLKSGYFAWGGERLNLEDKDIWNDKKRSKLMLYNLHYFDALNTSLDPADKPRGVGLTQLITRWITENPILSGNGWEPYPLSLRIVNWVKYFSRNPEQIEPNWHASLLLQARALRNQLEYHILGNHLFANAKALVFVGAYFDGAEAEKYLFKGLSLLDREIPEQFLQDGGHFERSPMYHAALLWDMCDLYYLSLITDAQTLKARQKQWEVVIQRGLSWCDAMTHPDGDISFFNDATFGVAPKLDDLKKYAAKLKIKYIKTMQPMRLLKDTGYCVVEMNQRIKAILNVGEIAPDYQPGHAHADTLSFELSIDATRVIVNSGISQYGQDETRHAERSTKAHSTVCIDEKNASDVWSGFRVGHRARVFDFKQEETDDAFKVACSHDGYFKQVGKNIHRRSWCFNQHGMTVQDSISGDYLRAEASFYLHPDISIVSNAEKQIILSLPNRKELVFCLESDGVLRMEPTLWRPGFGRKEQNNCIVVAFKGNELITRLGW